jgi:hypothetical protein
VRRRASQVTWEENSSLCLHHHTKSRQRFPPKPWNYDMEVKSLWRETVEVFLELVITIHLQHQVQDGYVVYYTDFWRRLTIPSITPVLKGFYKHLHFLRGWLGQQCFFNEFCDVTKVAIIHRKIQWKWQSSLGRIGYKPDMKVQIFEHPFLLWATYWNQK